MLFYIRWMLPWLLLVVLIAPHSYLTDIFFKQKTEFAFEILLIALRFVALIIGIYFESFTLAIASYCMVSFAVRVIIFGWYISIVKEYEKKVGN